MLCNYEAMSKCIKHGHQVFGLPPSAVDVHVVHLQAVHLPYVCGHAQAAVTHNATGASVLTRPFPGMDAT